MAAIDPSSGSPGKPRAWPLAVLFAIGNCAFLLVVTGVAGYLNEQARITWLITLRTMLEELGILRALALLPLILPPIVGMILHQRGKERLGRALILSFPWTFVVYAVGAAGVLIALIIHNGGVLFR